VAPVIGNEPDITLIDARPADSYHRRDIGEPGFDIYRP